MRAYILNTGWDGLDKVLTWLADNNDVKEITVLKNTKAFLEKAAKEKPELAFIKIGRTDTSGLNIGSMIATMHSDIRVVFISEEKNYAIDAFDVGAYGYLLCPIEKKKFDKMLSIIKESIHMDGVKEYLHTRWRKE